jgi:curved DNA-binding protein CbpA
MRAHHPDRFATDPDRLAAATRKAAQINAAYARIDRADRASRQ